MTVSRSHPSGARHHSLAAPEAAPSGQTKAGDWWDARREGRRLPEHELSDIEDLIWTQQQEAQP